MGRDGRVVCAVAGAPGSGKSTFAEALVARLGSDAALLPMDGFHYDDQYLGPAGLQARKGAPDTYDVGGLLATLRRLRADDEDRVAVPVFDRAIEIARAGARLIPRSARVIVAEGNWLLLDDAPWDALGGMFDLTVMLEVPRDELRARLRRRWEGFGLSEPAVLAKLDLNDLPNGDLVRERSRAADFVVRP